MKAKMIFCALASVVLASCADLGFGIDVDSDGYDPYYYGNGYYGYPWGNVGWDWDYPLYNPGPALPPPRPPLIGSNPTPSVPSVRPNVRPGGMNGVPVLSPNGSVRPGNGGLPSVEVPSTPAVNSGESNNARRGR